MIALPYHGRMPSGSIPPGSSSPALGSLVELLEALKRDEKLAAQVPFTAYLPAQQAAFGSLTPELAPALARALATQGAARLWSHQATGVAAVRRGEDLLVTTPTASGKSLIFQLPVLEEALAGGPGRALFLFPLKALGQDQRGKLLGLAAAAGLGPELAGCAIYDGDTPREERRRIKAEPPRVVISNPDMVHAGMLGSLAGWEPLLASLRWIVLDELHTYRGIFGSHFHHVLGRLLRVCRLHGSRPTLIASSATAANAEEFASRLTGRTFSWVAESGAPREGRHFVLLRPLASPYTTTLRLFVRLLEAGLKTIVFTKARRITELLYSWLRRQEPELARRVACYRSGFLPEERRSIEHRLFTGELAGVIATSALEMGIDVGGLDACILVGYPGSMMATWQRSGRVGRGGQESLTALVALPDALDQYILDHPQEFFERPCERLIVDPTNEPVARAHLVCAAAELPLSIQDDQELLEPFAPLVGELLREGELLARADGGELYAARRRPHREVSLRGVGATTTIVDSARGKALGTVDGVRVLHECHPGAIYLHAGRQYLIRELDLDARKVWAEAVQMDSFTTPLTEKETEVTEVLAERDFGAFVGRLGRLRVRERVVGYEEKRLGSQELLGRYPLELPESSFETVGLWWEVPRASEEELRLAGAHFGGSLHASEHAAISLCPLLALCDRGDIGGISYPLHPQVGNGAVFLYDGHPGGVGIMARVFPDLPDLLARVRDLLATCACEDGCPSCIQSPKCGNGNRPLDKRGAALALDLLLGRREPGAEARSAADKPRAALVAAPRRPWDEVAGPSSSAPPLPEPPAPVAPPPARPAVPPRRRDDEEAQGEKAPPGRKTRFAELSSPAATLARVGEPGHNTVLFDVETLRSADDVGGWNKAHRMGVAVAVALVLEEGRFEVYEEGRVRELVELLKVADLVVGFNIRRFDYAVLSGYTGEDYNRLLPTLDLLEDVHRRLGFRIGLGALAEATLGVGKSADGLQSLEWVKQGRLDLVTDYCRRDVEVLRDLFLFGRREGCVLYLDRQKRKIRLPVDW